MKKAGRPKQEITKDQRLSVRVSLEDKERIQNRAKELGFKNISEYIIHSCVTEMELGKL